MYDIFVVSRSTINKKLFSDITKIFPNAQLIENCKDFKTCADKSFTKMFWVIWDDFIVRSDFDLYSYRATSWDDEYVHVFKNGRYFDGVCLFPKSAVISQREFDNRFFINKKEIDIIASDPFLYDTVSIGSYDEYLSAVNSVQTNMFYALWSDINIEKNFAFDFQVPYYEHHITHVFRNGDYYDGLCLFSKNKIISKKEFDNRFFIEKKEIDIQASLPKKQIYDIVFISYNEPNADYNFEKLRERFPRAKRVHGVKGIHQAHIAAAKLANTDMFYVVDGDAFVVDDFNFDYIVPKYEKTHVHVWRSRNPFNELVYGYGGVKLLPTEKTISMDVNSTDMTTSISNNFKVVDAISNITTFNTDAFSSWKSAFRECVKLSSQVIARQESAESTERLDIWCKLNESVPFGAYAYLGAIMGKEYGNKHKGDIQAIKKINDFEWLKKVFDEIQQKP
jgi:hypothetical protein